MTHQFDIEIAQVVGVNAAVLFNHICFWVDKNKANDKHFIDGRYWTYSTTKGLVELFPYLTEKQIRTALEKLVEAGFIITGHYSKNNLNRTTWFAICEKGESARKGKCICPKGQNRFAQKGETITDKSLTDKSITLDSYESNRESVPKGQNAVDQIMAKWNAQDGLCRVETVTRSSTRGKALNARLKEYGLDKVLAAIDRIGKSSFLRGENDSGWQVTFDWFVKASNFVKVIEGQYDDKPVRPQKKREQQGTGNVFLDIWEEEHSGQGRSDQGAVGDSGGIPAELEWFE